MDLTQIILKPVTTEKTTTEEANSRYTFIVNKRATKIDIKNAIQALYGVKVKSVNVRPTPKKTRLIGRGREIVKRNQVKKASVTLEGGKSIDIYKFASLKNKKK